MDRYYSIRGIMKHIFRDRDAPISREGIIFRVIGYDHPPNSCVCDVEYAPSSIYKSSELRARREGKGKIYFKFYFDGGLRFVKKRFPQYQVYYEPLKANLVGLTLEQMSEIRKPDEKLSEILESEAEDGLIKSLKYVLEDLTSRSKLKLKDFGVFGSILHDFYHPSYSDLDLIIYGRRELNELLKTLEAIYSEEGELVNEFDEWSIDKPPYTWGFNHYSKREYGWYQRRKLIYGIMKSRFLNRDVNVEFEPVKKEVEIVNEYLKIREIRRLGWITATIRIIEDVDSYFMPSIYEVEVLEVDRRDVDLNVKRIVSYVEEFRGQLRKDEVGVVRGRLEEVEMKDKVFHQITLSYGENYFDQFLKLKTLR